MKVNLSFSFRGGCFQFPNYCNGKVNVKLSIISSNKIIILCFSVTNNFLYFSIFLPVSRASSLCHAFGDVHWYFGVPGSVIDSFYTILVSKVIFIWFSSFYLPDLLTTVARNCGKYSISLYHDLFSHGHF